jgi:deoxyribodipyrimidine photolyase
MYGGGMGNGGNGGPSTTLLSPYLKFGCVSARQMHATLLASYARTKALPNGKHTGPPTR